MLQYEVETLFLSKNATYLIARSGSLGTPAWYYINLVRSSWRHRVKPWGATCISKYLLLSHIYIRIHHAFIKLYFLKHNFACSMKFAHASRYRECTHYTLIYDTPTHAPPKFCLPGVVNWHTNIWLTSCVQFSYICTMPWGNHFFF